MPRQGIDRAWRPSDFGDPVDPELEEYPVDLESEKREEEDKKEALIKEYIKRRKARRNLFEEGEEPE